MNTSVSSNPAIVRSLLFVSGAQPERFAKALASGADCVCIDLEDSVPTAEKAQARSAALEAIGGSPQLALRMNGVRTREGLEDLLALAGSVFLPRFLLVPMVEETAELDIVSSILGLTEARLVPLIESVRGCRNADDIAAHPNVAMVMFGGGDLSAQLGVAMSWDALLLARSQIVMASAAACKPSIDVPWIALDDTAGLEQECNKARGLGLKGKAAIHPGQVRSINQAFSASEDEQEEARAALQAFDDAHGAAVRFRGRLLEAPLIARYRAMLSLDENGVSLLDSSS